MLSLSRYSHRCDKSIASSIARHGSNTREEIDREVCRTTLGVRKDSSQSDVRDAYLKLVKRYHPDGGSDEADVHKFNEVERAYRTLRDGPVERDGDAAIDRDELTAGRTVPQHRQYLTFDGVGAGTPSERQRQYAKFRAARAAENVLEHRLSRNLASPDDKALVDGSKRSQREHKVDTRYGFDRLVEDLIQESMSKGEFKNLSGAGKPLPTHADVNPYVDFTTHKLNQVLIDNGFTPEWITLQKEIRSESKTLEDGLRAERTRFGTMPFTDDESGRWARVLEKYEKLAGSINKKIAKYNLLVPIMQKQMILLRLDGLGDRIAAEGKTKFDVESAETNAKSTASGSKDLFGLLRSFFD